MAYLTPHFDPDVFVSYSHGHPSGRGSAPLKDWTQALIERLKSYILHDPEFDDLALWIDRTAYLSDELRGQVANAGVLIVVMSRRYLVSPWCNDELDWFADQIKGIKSEGGRIFLIKAENTDISKWPEILRGESGHGIVGFDFFERESGEHLSLILPEHAVDIERQSRLLQTALTKRLRDLREREAKRAEADAVMARQTTARGSGPRRIYLHASHDDDAARIEIGRALTDDGIVPLTADGTPVRGPAGWQWQAAARIEAAKRCDALTLLRTDDSERFVGDLLDVGVDERERIETARGTSIPCAVFDKTGSKLPIDVSAYGIKRFDVNRSNWRGEFRDWLDASRSQTAGAAR